LKQVIKNKLHDSAIEVNWGFGLEIRYNKTGNVKIIQIEMYLLLSLKLTVLKKIPITDNNEKNCNKDPNCSAFKPTESNNTYSLIPAKFNVNQSDLKIT
jgi:hypothetical protein